VKINSYVVISRAVEEGVATGVRRASKHSVVTLPDHEESVIATVEQEVLNALAEILIYEDQEAMPG